jgi:hypothetical protein
VCELVGDRFDGYSISHVRGRFRASELKSRTEAAAMLAEDLRYLIDETTAAVRFIIPLEHTKRVDPGLTGGFGFEDLGPPDDHSRELGQVRCLFFNLFAEAIVRVVQGEDVIWLLEDTGVSRRLYVWEKDSH